MVTTERLLKLPLSVIKWVLSSQALIVYSGKWNRSHLVLLSTSASEKGQSIHQTAYARLDLGGRIDKGLVKCLLASDLSITTVKLRYLSKHVLSLAQGEVDGVALHVNVLK